MRPTEIVLVLSNLLQLGVVAMPWIFSKRWIGYCAATGLALAVAQVLAEGPRWQMGPAYGTAAVLGVLWLLQSRSRTKSSSRQSRPRNG